MRDFDRTPEPPPTKRNEKDSKDKASGALGFVVHEHHARSLHFDVRLEAAGALASWAVPKGPPRATGERRLAVKVEDHPLEYADFHGTIPAGSYGAGEVTIWDRGRYEPEDGDPAEAIARGKITARFFGEKMRGAYTFVKMRGRGRKEDAWLMLKTREDDDDDDVPITHADRVLFPRDGITKRALVLYYRAVARWLLPYLEGRPLTLQRWPNGIDGPSFFEKEIPRGAPAWVKTISLASGGRTPRVRYVVCDDARTLAWVANLGTIALHVWMSRVPTLDAPDYALLDLDPWEGSTLGQLARVAVAVREALELRGLKALVKTSGGLGLHVLAPLVPVESYDRVKALAAEVARDVARALPRDVTLERMTGKRAPRTVYIDYVQVGRGKTIVPPYVVRGRDRAPVSMPLEWSEVEAMTNKRTIDTARAFARYRLENVPALLERDGDPWARAWRPQRLR